MGTPEHLTNHSLEKVLTLGKVEERGQLASEWMDSITVVTDAPSENPKDRLGSSGTRSTNVIATSLH